MKALVLAGGSGTRLRPLTHTVSKQLVPIANKPVLFHGLEAIAGAGITEVGVIIGPHGRDVRRAVGDGSRFGLRVTYIPQEEPLGLAHCVMIARDFLADDPFVMYLGDNVISGGIGHLVGEFWTTRPDALVMVGKVTNPSEYGVAELDADGRITRLVEKPAEPRSDLAVIGAYVFSAAVHQAVRAIKPSWRHEWEITDAISWLMETGGSVRAHVFSGYWKDTGRIVDLLDCNRALLDLTEPANSGEVDDESEIVGPVVIDAGARIVRSRVVGPAIVGCMASIVDSSVGAYTSIGAECDIVGTDIADSIVLEGSTVSGIDAVRQSVIGRYARVESSPAVAAAPARRLVLGDNTEVVIER
ncbi:glucose-1-phosphate thymidylyltransferase [Fodinicola acaciae]|uniref:glucose-1-phosphate thymidylyltransferase n=1 Tax=Fodinicola acaciae TaxID=2681555 RepID=UPI0013D3A19A|nr:glucose-1-phosphate thymidylyltransferase [Fodinicola acaciae]